MIYQPSPETRDFSDFAIGYWYRKIVNVRWPNQDQPLASARRDAYALRTESDLGIFRTEVLRGDDAKKA